MKKYFLYLMVCSLLFTPLVLAYPVDIEILNEKAIVKLSNDELIKAYIDVVVEIEALRAFHTTSGFTPKDYESFKGLLRYRILLLNEITILKLEVPRTE